MVDVAQLVRASVCGTEGRGFESHHLPKKKPCISKAFLFSSCSNYQKPPSKTVLKDTWLYNHQW